MLLVILILASHLTLPLLPLTVLTESNVALGSPLARDRAALLQASANAGEENKIPDKNVAMIRFKNFMTKYISCFF